MRTEDPRAIRLSDYEPPAYLVDRVGLNFELDPDRTLVRATLEIRRNEEVSGPRPLVLDGESLELISVKIDGTALPADRFERTESGLTIAQVPGSFTLEIETAIAPAKNTALEGLYMSKGMFCTQCEAEGFRRITYFPDRPDILSVYTTRIVADAAAYPVLLSNGNLRNRGEHSDGRHWVEWHDPFPKPSYLFALVGGDLAKVEDSFTTMSGRDVAVQIFVEPGDEDRCAYAIDSLKRAMRWDEETYGREYDLDIYMIVAVSHFNMGAMENKGLNIFNSQYVLAKPETATDLDYENIESIIAHEYFHNWSGNRVTCRDWFQLCLKEGLTVFRDQHFSADMRDPAVQRIKSVRALRVRQFAEDSGPLAHPVRPSSYIEIDNFYTSTVYEKGAELIRMIRIILGDDAFRAAMDLYFERHDGAAATVEDFVAAMENSSGQDLSQFRLWYSQAGTPIVTITRTYDRDARRLTLKIGQSTPPTPGQPDKAPLAIPIRVGVVADPKPAHLTERTIVLRQAQEDHVIEDVPGGAVPSCFRALSAPVKIEDDLSPEELLFLMGHDDDPFNRWEAGRRTAERIILDGVASLQAGRPIDSARGFHQALQRTLNDPNLDPYFVAETLALPAEVELAQAMAVIDPDNLYRARLDIERQLAAALQDDLHSTYRRFKVDAPYDPGRDQAARRSLRNRALRLLATLDTDDTIALAYRHYSEADNMTDAMAGLGALSDTDRPQRQQALDAFYARWKDDDLVINKWLGLQAASRAADALDRIKKLMDHESFDIKNPNRVRALIGTFAHGNQLRFHNADGSGYEFVISRVLQIDPLNPQIAARLVTAFGNWQRFDQQRCDKIEAGLRTLLAADGLSKNVFEIADKILKSKPD